MKTFIIGLNSLKLIIYICFVLFIVDDSHATTGQGWLEMVAYFGRHTHLYNVRPPDDNPAAVYQHYYGSHGSHPNSHHPSHPSHASHSRAGSSGSEAPYRPTEAALSDHSPSSQPSLGSVNRAHQVQTPTRSAPDSRFLYGSPPRTCIKGEPMDQGYYAAERAKARSHSPPREIRDTQPHIPIPRTLSHEDPVNISVSQRTDYSNLNARQVVSVDNTTCSAADENHGANRNPVSLALSQSFPHRDDPCIDIDGSYFKIKPSLTGLPVPKQSSYRCPVCTKLFLHNSSFNRHMKLHQGVFSHICAVCGRKFTRREHFVRHKCNRRPNKPSRMLGSGEEAMSDRLAYPPSPTHSDNRLPYPPSPIRNESHNYDMDGVHLQPTQPDGTDYLMPENLAESGKSRRKTSTPQKVGIQYRDEEEGSSQVQSIAERLSEPASLPMPYPQDYSRPHDARVDMSLALPHTNHQSRPHYGSIEEESASTQTVYPKPNGHEAGVDTEGLLNLSTRPSPTSQNDSPRSINRDRLSNRSSVEDRRSDEQDEAESAYRRGIPVDPDYIPVPEDLTYGGPASDNRMQMVASGSSSLQESPPETPLSAPASLRGSPSPGSKDKETACTVCHKTFLHHSSLNRHLKLHMGVFTHACAVCGRRFTRKEHFLQHKCSRRPKDPTRQVDRASSLLESAQQVVFPPTGPPGGAQPQPYPDPGGGQPEVITDSRPVEPSGGENSMDTPPTGEMKESYGHSREHLC